MTRRLILVRHGESEANRDDTFTGWRDPPLTARGRAQAEAAGRCLAAHALHVDAAFASPRLRTMTTSAIILGVLGQGRLRTGACAGLTERDYGELSGLAKSEAAARWGNEQVRRWRRSYAEAPPGGESLRDASARILAAYLGAILPAAMRGTALVVAHGNSLRALIMALERLTPAQIEEVEPRTGSVRLYALAADTTVAARTLLDEARDADSGRL